MLDECESGRVNTQRAPSRLVGMRGLHTVLLIIFRTPHPILQVTITIAFYAGVALIDAGCGGADSNWCNGVSLLEYAVRSLIMLSTVVAINFNITHIRFCIQVHTSMLSRGSECAR